MGLLHAEIPEQEWVDWARSKMHAFSSVVLLILVTVLSTDPKMARDSESVYSHHFSLEPGGWGVGHHLWRER